MFRAEDLPGEAFVGLAKALLAVGFTAGQRSAGGTIGKEIGGVATRGERRVALVRAGAVSSIS